MTETWALAALWLGLALLSIWLRIATALSEIVVGTIAQLIIGAAVGTAALRAKWKETGAVGQGLRLCPRLGEPPRRSSPCAGGGDPGGALRRRDGGLIEQSRRHHVSLLDRLKEKTGQAGVSARFEVLVGHVPRQILDYAASHGVDMIVIGRRGHGVLDRWLLGSVSSRVVEHAQCSVTVVR